MHRPSILHCASSTLVRDVESASCLFAANPHCSCFVLDICISHRGCVHTNSVTLFLTVRVEDDYEAIAGRFEICQDLLSLKCVKKTTWKESVQFVYNSSRLKMLSFHFRCSKYCRRSAMRLQILFLYFMPPTTRCLDSNLSSHWEEGEHTTIIPREESRVLGQR